MDEKQKKIITDALEEQLRKWVRVNKEMPGLTSTSRHFKLMEFDPEKKWIVVKSKIYPPYNILDYDTLAKGIIMDLDGRLILKNSNDYSTEVEKSSIQRKNKSGISSVSILTKYYRVIHMEFCKLYREHLANK